MWLTYIDHVPIFTAQYKEHMDFIRFKAQTIPYLKYGREKFLAFAALIAVANGMNENAWIGLMIGIMCPLL